MTLTNPSYNDTRARAALQGYIGDGFMCVPLVIPQVVIQGTWAFAISANHPLNQYFSNSTVADGDSVTFRIWLDECNYKFVLLCHTHSGGGIVDISIGGTVKATFDLYSAGLVYGVVKESGPQASPSGSLKDLGITLDGKNGASSGYSAHLNALLFWRV